MDKTTSTPRRSLEQRIKASPSLLNKYRKDPGLRSKLPDRYLTGQQRTARKTNQTNALIGAPLASLQGTTLQDIAKQITDGDYKPAYADLDTQTGKSKRETVALSDRAAAYYEALNKANAERTGQQGAATAKQDQALAGIGQQAQGQIQAAQEQGQAAITQDTELRGAGLQADNVKGLAERMAQAKAGAATSSQIDRTQGTARGFTAETMARGLETAGANRGGETQGDIARRGQSMLDDLLEQRTKLQTQERGDYTKNLMSLRDRQGEIELAKAQILGTQTAAQVKAESDAAAAKTAAAEKRRDREFRATEAQKERESREGAASYKGRPAKTPAKKRPTTGLGSLTQAQENQEHDKISSARSLAEQLKNTGLTQTEVRRRLLQGQTGKNKQGQTIKTPAYPRDFVNAVMDLLYRDGLSRANVRALQARGIHVGGKYPILKNGGARKPAASTGIASLGDLASIVSPVAEALG